MLTDDDREELRRLQRRAYGTGEDTLSAIETARLAELMAAERTTGGGRTGGGPADRNGIISGGARTPASGRRAGTGGAASALDARPTDVLGRTSAAAASMPEPGSSAASETSAVASVADSALSAARRRRALLASGAAVALIVAFAGGWFAGNRGTPSDAPADPAVAATLAMMQERGAFDEGSFRLLAFVNGTVYAGGTTGGNMCAFAATVGGSVVTQRTCAPADVGTTLPMPGTGSVAAGGEWTLDATWDGTELVAAGLAASAVTTMTVTPQSGVDARFAVAAMGVSTSAEWATPPVLVASYAELSFWSGGTAAGNVLCVSQWTPDHASTNCADPQALPADVSDYVHSVAPETASFRFGLRGEATELAPNGETLYLDITPAAQ